jgi:hypothetical protein
MAHTPDPKVVSEVHEYRNSLLEVLVESLVKDNVDHATNPAEATLYVSIGGTVTSHEGCPDCTRFLQILPLEEALYGVETFMARSLEDVVERRRVVTFHSDEGSFDGEYGPDEILAIVAEEVGR